MTDKKTGGPAFPVTLQPGEMYKHHAEFDGMTLRDYFAAHALHTISAYPPRMFPLGLPTISPNMPTRPPTPCWRPAMTDHEREARAAIRKLGISPAPMIELGAVISYINDGHHQRQY
ncbi:hypothetical protein OMD46_16665 [Pseudomonas sp. MDMC_285]|nr:hypothetical protein [Pseudomonas sp. MDMC_285]